MADYIGTIMRAEEEGVSNLTESTEYARALIMTGVVNATGSTQRFVNSLIDSGIIYVNGDLTDKGQALVDNEEN